ncbi:MAG: helix-turn-helix domain-containing protein [Solirubrobacteraceae bacterium]
MPAQPPRRRGRPPAGGREAILAAALELLRERGVARLTTRAVAQAAGVSEASVFYHYADRAGLLQAVFEVGVAPMQALGEEGIAAPSHRETLSRLGAAIERFLDQTLPVTTAAQSDVQLRDALAAYMAEHDLGPHRGVQVLADYIAGEQAAGRMRSDVDPPAVALMFVGACYIRAAQRQMRIHRLGLPPLDDAIAALDAMLETTHTPGTYDD